MIDVDPMRPPRCRTDGDGNRRPPQGHGAIGPDDATGAGGSASMPSSRRSGPVRLRRRPNASSSSCSYGRNRLLRSRSTARSSAMRGRCCDRCSPSPVLLIVFTRIIRIGSQIDNYPMFLLFNIVFFGLPGGHDDRHDLRCVARESIVRKTQFPRLVIPLAMVLTGLFEPRHGEPARGRRLLRLLRDRSDLDVAVVPGAVSA